MNSYEAALGGLRRGLFARKLQKPRIKMNSALFCLCVELGGPSRGTSAKVVNWFFSIIFVIFFSDLFPESQFPQCPSLM
jgi:hypothetical protein